MFVRTGRVYGIPRGGGGFGLEWIDLFPRVYVLKLYQKILVTGVILGGIGVRGVNTTVKESEE